MTRDGFEHALAVHGADFARWPPDLGAAARAFASRDPDAAALLASAARLDALLVATVRPAHVDAATVGRIIAGVSGTLPAGTAVRPTGRLFAFAGVSMAVFLVAGFVLGLAVPFGSDDDTLSGLIFGPNLGVSIEGDLL
jgi:hypothetical protein